MKMQAKSLATPTHIFSKNQHCGQQNRPHENIQIQKFNSVNRPNDLYRYIDLTTLVEVFFTRLNDYFRLNSIQFQLPDRTFCHNSKVSTPLPHECFELSFKLWRDDDILGTLSLYRTRQFVDFEVTKLNAFVNEFTGPLSNALSYANACYAASHDDLTGLYNRTALNTAMYDVSSQGTAPSGLMVFDIDGFKTINDKYGHTVGDKVLRQFSRKLLAIAPDGDLIFRYGGDEFVIVHFESIAGNPQFIAEKIRRSVEESTLKIGNICLDVTTTVGVTTIHHDDTFEQAFDRADSALMSGKKSGRNRVLSA